MTAMTFAHCGHCSEGCRAQHGIACPDCQIREERIVCAQCRGIGRVSVRTAFAGICPGCWGRGTVTPNV